MNFNTHWDYLDASPIEVVREPPKGILRLKYASAAGFFLFVISAVLSLTTPLDWLWTLAVIGGSFWVGFGSAYRKNMVKPKEK